MAHSKGPAGAAAQVARGDATSDLGAVSGSHLRSSRDMGWPRKHSHANLASFEGSFAASARPGASAARAKPWYADREYFLQGWTSRAIWKAAFVEGVATAGLAYVSGQITATIMNYKIVQIGPYVGISITALVATFIYATSPGTGGHVNPLITFSAILCGICPVSRGVLYMCAQTGGAALAGAALIGAWGSERAVLYQGGGCFFDAAEVSSGQVLLNEVFSSFVLLYLAYGVGLDPRQAVLFGPRLGPLLVGITVGLLSFSSSGSVPGYSGAQMHPARCFAYGIARRDFSGQWVWWFGPAAAACLLAVLYNLIPPSFSTPVKDENQRHVLPIQSSA